MVASLDRQIAHLDSGAIWTGTQGIVALVGDGHTHLQTPGDAANFPIEVARFGEDYRISSVVAGLENALGGRVLKVDETPISRTAEFALPLAARDENPPLAGAFVEDALTTGATLHGLGRAGRQICLDPAVNQPPLYRENPESQFWCRYLPDARTLYCNVRAIRNLYAGVKGDAGPRDAAQSG